MKWLRKLFAPAPAALQCEICGGHGRVAVWSGISRWPPVTSMVVCTECNGTGRAAGVTEVPSVNPLCGVHGPIPCPGAGCICARGVALPDGGQP